MARILLVDDEAAVLDGLAAYLANPRVEIVCATNLDDARAKVRDGNFDLVLSDLRMTSPVGKEGLELLRLVRSGGRGRFALMTGFASPEVEAEATEGGADAFLSKPLDFDALDRLVEDVLDAIEADAQVVARGAVEAPAKRRFRLSDPEAGALLSRYAESRDEAAFDTLIKTFTPLVYSVPIKWYGLPKEEADEVFQDVMVQLLQKAGEIRNVRLWLIGTAVNCSRRRFGGAERFRRIADKWGADETHRQEIHVDAENDLRAALRHEVDHLPETQRKLVLAIYYEGLSYKEIAERFDMPEGSIGPTRGRIVRSLVTKMRSDGAPAKPLSGSIH